MSGSINYDLTGTWEGKGVEVRINRETNEVDDIELFLVRKIRNYRKNTYVFSDIYYFPDGTINFGPTDLLVNTGGAREFIFADDYATGIDSILICYQDTSIEYLKYNYNINNINPDIDPVYKSLDGNYNLTRVKLES